MSDPEAVTGLCDGMDQVLHIAAIHPWKQYTTQQYLDLNIKGTHNVIAEAARAKADRLIYTSSVSAIGYNVAPDAPLPWDERCPAARRTHLQHHETRRGAVLSNVSADDGLPGWRCGPAGSRRGRRMIPLRPRPAELRRAPHRRGQAHLLALRSECGRTSRSSSPPATFHEGGRGATAADRRPAADSARLPASAGPRGSGIAVAAAHLGVPQHRQSPAAAGLRAAAELRFVAGEWIGSNVGVPSPAHVSTRVEDARCTQ